MTLKLIQEEMNLSYDKTDYNELLKKWHHQWKKLHPINRDLGNNINKRKDDYNVLWKNWKSLGLL